MFFSAQSSQSFFSLLTRSGNCFFKGFCSLHHLHKALTIRCNRLAATKQGWKFNIRRSERELMLLLPERLDYLWFPGYSPDDEAPNQSVLSKARARWAHEVFQNLFIRSVSQCVRAGLVDGSKIHRDGSLIGADASKDSVVKASPELIDRLCEAYGAVEARLDGNLGEPDCQPVNRGLLSTTDPDNLVNCADRSKFNRGVAVKLESVIPSMRVQTGLPLQML